ncbi:MAG: GDYXXLXY domain-containing protein [Myxococcaceae bacterium]|nr:GDYXXLXY domain-containing protein [Myxococcaceae bacterium]MCI0670991.1 GDYXXLXY domain-containing protein [Myxococcaceae bacterium]
MRHAHVLWLGLAVVLLGVNGSILAKEHILATGTPVLLELGPRDPRSLMQGDYMVLRYRLAQAQPSERGAWPRQGRLVLRLDARGVAQETRPYREDEPLGPGERLLRFKLRKGELRLGAESFFFEEGKADRFANARYGELRVDAAGNSVLVGLRDGTLRPLDGR